MKRYIVFAALLTTPMLPAQVDIIPHDGAAEFAFRFSLNNEWAAQRFSVDSYGGGFSEVTNIKVVIQDINCATPGTNQIVMFGESTATPGTPAFNTRVIDTGPFMPQAGTGGCAVQWTVTPPMPVAHPGTDLFVGSYLPADPGLAGGTDGYYGQVSIEVAGGCPSMGTCSLEFPNGLAVAQYPPATPGVGPGAEFGLGLTATGVPRYSTDWISWLHRMAPGNDHVARSGANDPTGAVFSAVPAINPDNFGMAGRFPDATNATGTAPPRSDNQVWETEHGSIQTGVGVLVLTGRTLRDGGIPPIDFPGLGRLELDPTDGLFAPSAGGLPGLTGPISGPTATYRVDLTAAGVRQWMRGGVKVTVQEVRADLATGALSLSTLATSTWL